MAGSKNVAVKDGNEVEVVRPSSLSVPDHLRDLVEADYGAGTSSAAEDNVVPLLKLLQSNNPQTKQRDPLYIDGAAAGDFFFKAHDMVAPGDGGIVVTPCGFQKAWVEWVSPEPGSGYVGQHASLPDDAEEYPDPKDPKRKMWRRKDTKHHLEETRYHYVLVQLPGVGLVPYVIPFKSTGHTTSREWMFMMNSYKGKPRLNPKTGIMETPVLASWHRRYSIASVPKKNAKGEWFAMKISPLGFVETAEEYEAGKLLNMSVSTGEVVADKDDDLAGSGPGNVGADTSSAAQHI